MGELKYLRTRRLQQDSIENLFGVIRQQGGQRGHPDSSQFREAYRQVCINGLLSTPDTANCEPDEASLLGLASTAARTDKPLPRDRVQVDTPASTVDCIPLDTVTSNCLTYVAGYLARRGLFVSWGFRARQQRGHFAPIC